MRSGDRLAARAVLFGRGGAVSFVLSLLAAFVGWWPESLVRLVARIAGTAWAFLVPYRHGVVNANLAQAFPEAPPRERRRIARAAYVHLVQTLLEFIRIRAYVRRGFPRIDRRGVEHLAEAKARGKGTLILSGHLGSFELVVAGSAEEFAPVSLVVKPFTPGVDAFVNDTRRSAGLKIIPAAGAVRPVLKALKNNETVVFVLDQNATRSIGVFVDFFGKSACTMTGLAVLAERTGATVVGVKPYRERDGHVAEISAPIPFERMQTRAETVEHMTQRYTEWIEAAIREHPEQWFWTHKRFRTRPLPPG